MAYLNEAGSATLGLGRPVPGLAYPFGYSNPEVRRLAADVGCTYAGAVGHRPPGPALDSYAMPRLTVSWSIGLGTYAQLADCRILPVIFLNDRSLTKGWAKIRRASAIARRRGRRDVNRVRAGTWAWRLGPGRGLLTKLRCW
jgi:hypothetical protein